MYPKAYIDFLAYFHGSRDYFECHEVLEEFWKQQENEGRDSIWVGLIQVSVALYHQRIGNFSGAYRTLKKGVHILESKKDWLDKLGLDSDRFIQLLQRRLAEIDNEQPYYSLNIPIADKALLETCQDRCKEMGSDWNSPSDLSNENLIFKHSLRDRTEVIQERRKQLKCRKTNRP